MTEHPIELVPTGPEHIELIRNLYQFYAYESSDWEQEDVEVDGRFYIHEEHLARYWSEPEWSANLILVDGFIAGFVLIEGSELPGIDALELADVFVLKKYRRQGVGRTVVTRVLLPATLPGIMDTLRVTMGWAWTYLVVAELVASSSGLGYMSMQAMRGLHADFIFVAILVIGFLGLCTDQIFKWIKVRFLPWAEQR